MQFRGIPGSGQFAVNMGQNTFKFPAFVLIKAETRYLPFSAQVFCNRNNSPCMIIMDSDDVIQVPSWIQLFDLSTRLQAYSAKASLFRISNRICCNN